MIRVVQGLFAGLLGFLIVVTASAQEACEAQLRLTVTIEGASLPSSVAVQHDGFNSTALLPEEVKKFKGCVNLPSTQHLTNQGRLYEEADILAVWASLNQSIPLALHPRISSPVRVTMFEISGESYNHQTMLEIEKLPGDVVSQLEKYLRAKDFYSNWIQVGAVTHSIAIRSAKAWFDSAVNLALLKNSPIAMDDEASTVMKNYEQTARTEFTSNFSLRYRKHVKPGYVNGMLQQVTAAQFAFVGGLPDMLRTNSESLEAITALNTQALAVFSSLTASDKRVVTQAQGINEKILKDNDAYFTSLARN